MSISVFDELQLFSHHASKEKSEEKTHFNLSYSWLLSPVRNEWFTNTFHLFYTSLYIHHSLLSGMTTQRVRLFSKIGTCSDP